MTDDENAKMLKIFNLLVEDPNHILIDFLDLKLPGFKNTDPLEDISPLLASRNPGAVFMNHTSEQATQKVGPFYKCH